MSLSLIDVLKHGPVFDCLLRHLPIISIMSLRRSVGHLLKYSWRIYNRFWRRCVDHLRDEGEVNGDLFMQLLDTFEDGQMTLSGGFVLKVLLGDYSAMNDVDVYFPKEGNGFTFNDGVVKYTNAFFDALSYIQPLLIDEKRTRYPVNLLNSETNHRYECDYVVDVLESKIGKIYVQQILTHNDDYYKLFDFSMCMNVMTDSRIIVLHPFHLLKMQGHVSEREVCRIFTVRPRFVDGDILEKWIKRLKKYRERGFCIILDENEDVADFLIKHVNPIRFTEMKEKYEKLKKELF